MTGIESIVQKPVEKPEFPTVIDESSEHKEFLKDIEGNNKPVIEPPDVSFIERISRSALIEQCPLKATETKDVENSNCSEASETKSEGLTEEEKTKIKEETGWSDEIIDNIKKHEAI